MRRRGRHRLHGLAADRRASPSTASCWTRRRSASSPARSSRALSAWGAFRLIAPDPGATRARQLSGTADELLDLADDVDPDARPHPRRPRARPVTLLEYGDFECPYCGQAETVIRELLVSLRRRAALRLAPPAAQRRPPERAARRPRRPRPRAPRARFWEMHDTLIAHQDELLPTRPPALRRRSSASTSTASGRSCATATTRRASPRTSRSADASGVSGTPTFFINGRRHQGVYDIDTLSAEVRAALRPLSTGQSSNRR